MWLPQSVVSHSFTRQICTHIHTHLKQQHQEHEHALISLPQNTHNTQFTLRTSNSIMLLGTANGETSSNRKRKLYIVIITVWIIYPNIFHVKVFFDYFFSVCIVFSRVLWVEGMYVGNCACVMSFPSRLGWYIFHHRLHRFIFYKH